MRTEIPIELNSNSQLKEVYTCLAAQKIVSQNKFLKLTPYDRQLIPRNSTI